MAITNLTGTTWLINRLPATPSVTIYGYIDFTSNSNQFDAITLYNKRDGDGNIAYRMGTDYPFTAYDSLAGWAASAYRTITITGGTDVTNASLISWLEANATQVQTTMIYTTTGTELSSIADAIRSATGQSGDIEYPDGFISGISNIKSTLVVGEFTTQSTSGRMDINIPYSGNGNPIAYLAYPSNGLIINNPGIFIICLIKADPLTPPTYIPGDNANIVYGAMRNYNGSVRSTLAIDDYKHIYYANVPSGTSNGANTYFTSNKTMKIDVSTSSSGGKYIPSITYTYLIEYSE